MILQEIFVSLYTKYNPCHGAERRSSPATFHNSLSQVEVFDPMMLSNDHWGFLVMTKSCTGMETSRRKRLTGLVGGLMKKWRIRWLGIYVNKTIEIHILCKMELCIACRVSPVFSDYCIDSCEREGRSMANQVFSLICTSSPGQDLLAHTRHPYRKCCHS